MIPIVENMKSNQGSKVPNQLIIITEEGVYFQSYETIIAFKPTNRGKIQLDKNSWDYSATTGRYRNEFLEEGIAETRKKIASGEYELVDLNSKANRQSNQE